VPAGTPSWLQDPPS